MPHQPRLVVARARTRPVRRVPLPAIRPSFSGRRWMGPARCASPLRHRRHRHVNEAVHARAGHARRPMVRRRARSADQLLRGGRRGTRTPPAQDAREHRSATCDLAGVATCGLRLGSRTSAYRSISPATRPSGRGGTTSRIGWCGRSTRSKASTKVRPSRRSASSSGWSRTRSRGRGYRRAHSISTTTRFGTWRRRTLGLHHCASCATRWARCG